MNGFYNPYTKGPDFGGGISDIINKVVQMLLLKKAYPGQDKSAASTKAATMPPSQGYTQIGEYAPNVPMPTGGARQFPEINTHFASKPFDAQTFISLLKSMGLV